MTARRATLFAGVALFAGCDQPRDSRTQAPGPLAKPPVQASVCAPCRIEFAPMPAGLEIRFLTDSQSAGTRRLRGLSVGPVGAPASDLVLHEPATIGATDSVMIDVVSLGPSAQYVLTLATILGAPNAPANYWLYDAKASTWDALGEFPHLSVDNGRVCAFERGGGGGIEFERTELAMQDAAMKPVRRWTVKSTDADDRFRMTRVSWRDGIEHVDTTRLISRADAERQAREATSPCP